MCILYMKLATTLSAGYKTHRVRRWQKKERWMLVACRVHCETTSDDGSTHDTFQIPIQWW